MNITIPDEHFNEIKQQLYADENYDGFNRQMFIIAYLEDVLGLDTRELRVE